MSNATIDDITATLTTKTLSSVKNIFRTAIDFVIRYLRIGLQWLGHQTYEAIAAVWRALRIGDLLHFLQFTILLLLKWLGIGLAIIIGTPIIWRVGHWGLPKLLEIYKERQRRKLEEERLNNARKRRAAEQAERAAVLEEARLRRAREEQAVKDKLHREEEERQAKCKADYANWEKECETAFQDRASMTRFPFPKLPRCTELECVALAKNPAPACQHNVKQFLKGSGRFSVKLLKDQIKLWHEDRFAPCREDLRPEFQRLATSLFVALFPLYEEMTRQEA